MKKFNIISLGCAKNLVDSEILLGGLKEEQLSITNNPDEADTIIVNTCGFLDIAREESIETILQAAELKKEGNLKELVVMGCLSERYPLELSKDIPEIDQILVVMIIGKLFHFYLGKNLKKMILLFLDL